MRSQWFSGAYRKKAKHALAALDNVFRINPDFYRSFVESVAPYRDPAGLEKLINA
jgi:hypothetical protein